MSGTINDHLLLSVFSDTPVPSKICFLKFSESENVGVALHLNSTVFIDRAMVVTPVMDGEEF